jgi:hypothetical protein
MKFSRPKTPRVIIDSSSNEDNQTNDSILKNFSNFMRQIVENENEKFLNGDVNLIDYVLSKYLKLSVNDLKQLNKLSIKISGSYGLLNQFGQRLTELIYLKLNHSFIQSINDLGSNFKNLKILQMNQCKLKDLSGIICFECLEVFEAKNNQISDLIELEMCTSLKKLDLENNQVEKMENIYFLSSLDKLIYLNLLNNPIKDYEQKVKELLPDLKELNIPHQDLSDEYYNSINTKFSDTKVMESVSTNNDSKTINTNKEINNKISENYDCDDNIINEDIESNIINEINFTPMNTEKSINFPPSIGVIKPKFDLTMSKNDKTNNVDVNGLKPVITKKRESKDIQMLRQSFTKGGMSSTGTNFYKTKKIENKLGTSFGMNNFGKNFKTNSGIKFFKDLKNKHNEKNKNKNTDKFFEELKNKRLIGNK